MVTLVCHYIFYKLNMGFFNLEVFYMEIKEKKCHEYKPINRSCFILQTVSVPYIEKMKDGQPVFEYQEEGVQDPVMDALLKQCYRMFTVCCIIM